MKRNGFSALAAVMTPAVVIFTLFMSTNWVYSEKTPTNRGIQHYFWAHGVYGAKVSVEPHCNGLGIYLPDLERSDKLVGAISAMTRYCGACDEFDLNYVTNCLSLERLDIGFGVFKNKERLLSFRKLEYVRGLVDVPFLNSSLPPHVHEWDLGIRLGKNNIEGVLACEDTSMYRLLITKNEFEKLSDEQSERLRKKKFVSINCCIPKCFWENPQFLKEVSEN